MSNKLRPSKFIYDVAIIGGGINGCGIAADAALRGLSVLLIEKDDLASKTSSSSTKLIHGGLRYLENFQFSMVRKSLNERQILLDMASHLVSPLPIVIPWQHHLRPAWMLRTGLFLYDRLSSSNQLAVSQCLTKYSHPEYFHPLKNHFDKSFLFYDGVTDDARLTITNALQAQIHGADILTRTSLVKTEVKDNVWQIITQNHEAAHTIFHARSIINAAGPWVSDINLLLNIPQRQKISLVKGSHILVKRLYEGEHAYLLQHTDKRIVFVIPYHGYTMVGTTEIPFSGNSSLLSVSEKEINYLLDLCGLYFNKLIEKTKVIHSWCGVRPLLADEHSSAHDLSRDYICHFSHFPAPAVSVYGGKITTYRHLAENAVDHLKTVFTTLPPSVTRKTPLPGARYDDKHYEEYVLLAPQKYPWIDKNLLARLLKSYGTRVEFILKDAAQLNDLGQHFGYGLYQREVDYLCQSEWALSAEDILWRRTKLGLEFNKEDTLDLTNYLASPRSFKSNLRACSTNSLKAKSDMLPDFE